MIICNEKGFKFCHFSLAFVECFFWDNNEVFCSPYNPFFRIPSQIQNHNYSMHYLACTTFLLQAIYSSLFRERRSCYDGPCTSHLTSEQEFITFSFVLLRECSQNNLVISFLLHILVLNLTDGIVWGKEI